MPRAASTLPDFSTSTAAAMAASSPSVAGRPGSVNLRCGPQTGHAIGSAWNRRSSGSSYSRRHSAQSSKRAMLVFGRSYGSDSISV